MPWHDGAQPVRMQRVAVVASREGLRSALLRVADAGTVELDVPADTTPAPGSAGARLARLHSTRCAPVLSALPPDLDALEREERADLLSGEAQLERRAAAAVVRGDVAAMAGWAPTAAVPAVHSALSEIGAAVVPLPRPPGSEPPTLLRPTGARRPFAPLVDTYATVPYADVDPTLVAGLAYVVMFGAMFADAGQGAVLALGALALAAGRLKRVSGLRPSWPFLAAAGVASCIFGVLYGEFFGPTGVLPVRWIAPLDQPVQLLVAGVGLGAVLLAGAYALGTVNRWREGGWRRALYAPSGVAGAGLFLALGLVVAGAYWGTGWLLASGAAAAVVALALAFAGLLADAGGGAAGVGQASIELFDIVVRLGSNLVSFARLAAFGLTHAALALVVWQATTALWGNGPLGMAGAVLVFLLGNAVTFALEGLVAAVQALRLEYYELFSRIFSGDGRPFDPWHVPVLEGASA